MKQEIEIETLGIKEKFQIIDLPHNFLEWQSVTRQKMFKILKTHGASGVKMQPGHLPVMATWSEGKFPVNLATRGMGLLPKQDLLDEFSSLFENTKKETETLPLADSLPKRLAILEEFYTNIENFDTSLLGGLEIFEGQTAKNLKNKPFAALIYTGTPPKYPSYQFNGVVTRVEEHDPYYRFLLSARELFAMDAFHIHQIRYPFGYLFHVIEIKDKTPYPKR